MNPDIKIHSNPTPSTASAGGVQGARPPRRNYFNAKMAVIILAALLVVAVGAAAYFFYAKEKSPDAAQPQEEMEKVIAEVGKLMVLPANEVPTLATVSDPEQLRNQPFFQNAEVGDKVLIYSKARKAILYSPTLKKIKEIAPLNLEDQPVQ